MSLRNTPIFILLSIVNNFKFFTLELRWILKPKFQFLFPLHPVCSLPPPTNFLRPICICFSAWEPPLYFPYSAAYTRAGEAFPRKLLEPSPAPQCGISPGFSDSSLSGHPAGTVQPEFQCLRSLYILKSFFLFYLISTEVDWNLSSVEDGTLCHTCQLCSFLLLSYIKVHGACFIYNLKRGKWCLRTASLDPCGPFWVAVTCLHLALLCIPRAPAGDSRCLKSHSEEFIPLTQGLISVKMRLLWREGALLTVTRYFLFTEIKS